MKKASVIISIALSLMLIFCFSSCKKQEEKKSDYETVKKENGVLRILISPENPPFEFRQSDEIVGVDTVIAERIAQQIGVKYTFVEKNYADLIDALIAGEGDIVVSAYIYNNEREGVSFSNVYLDNSLSLLTLADNEEILSVDNLEGKIVAVQENSLGDFYISDYNNLKDIRRNEYVSQCVDELLSGETDAVICDINSANYYIRSNEKIKASSIEGTNEKYVVAMRKDSDLATYVNEAVNSFKFNDDVEGTIVEYTVHIEPPEESVTESSVT